MPLTSWSMRAGVDVALAAGVADRALELGAVERLALAVLLDAR